MNGCIWLKYLPACSFIRSWPLSTSLKVARGPTERVADAAPSSKKPQVEPWRPLRRSGAPVDWVIGEKVLDADTVYGSQERTTALGVARLEVKFQAAALETEPLLKHHTNSLTGWL